MKKKKFQKAMSVTAAAALMVPLAANVVNVQEVSAAEFAGASYYQTIDNVGQGGVGNADGDLDKRLTNTDDIHPIEFNINALGFPKDAASAALVIRGHDVDEEEGEWDRVYLNGGSQPIGALSGNNNTENSTVFYLDPADIEEGNNYIEITINDKNRPTYNSWALTVDWGQIVINDGPKDKIKIDRDSPPLINGTGASREVTYTALPQVPGIYIAEINLLDKNGNNVATIQKEIIATNTDAQKLIAEFNGVKEGEYTANVVFLEKDGKSPGQIQDMWTSNKPPVVRTLTNLTSAAINEAFVDLDNPEDALAEVTFSGIPAGTLYAGGEKLTVNNGTAVLTPAQIESGLAFVPQDPKTKQVTFTWNGSDGKMYALAPAEVILNIITLKPVEKSLKQNQKLFFTEDIILNEYYTGDKPAKTITITSVPEKIHGLKDESGNLVESGQTFKPEEFGKLIFDATGLDEGKALFQWSVSDGTNQSVPGQMAFAVTDGISPAIETAMVNHSDPYPKTITLTYGEGVQLQDAAGFTVEVDGLPTDITSAELSGKNQIILTLSEPIEPGAALTLSYEAEKGNLTDVAGNLAVSLTGESAIKISNQVREPLDGWVGDRANDGTKEVIAKPGDGLLLSAISERNAEKVEAVLFKGTKQEVIVPLSLTSSAEGHKVWKNTEFDLPETIKTGDYQVEFIAYDAEDKVIQTETEDRKANNGFYIAAEIDLTGTVTDQRNKEPLTKAVVTLFDADTNEPIIDPVTKKQFHAETDEKGKYKFTAVPTGKVYMTIQKPGYNTVSKQAVDTMPKSKEQTVITSDATLSKASSGGSVPVYIPDASLDLSVSSERVLAGTTSKVAIKYENKATAPLHIGTISVTLPEGAKVTNPDGGKVDGQKITWTVNNVSAGKDGQFNIEVKWPEIEPAETTVQISGTLTATNPNTAAQTFTSSAAIQLYKAKEELMQHTRYIMGYKDGEFKPGESVTRGQLAAILARLAGNPEVKGTLTYRDVKEGQWATDYIKVVTKYGYFSGYGDGTFRQGKALTRGELASVMVRYLDLEVNQKPNYHFTDTKGHWAAAAIETLYSKNYISGYKNGSFRPDNAIDRAEAVTMINRMLERGPLNGHAPIYSDINEKFWAFGDIQEATISHESHRNEDGSETFKDTIKDTVK